MEQLLVEHDAPISPLEKIELIQQAGKNLFGEEFLMIPHFTFNTDQASELNRCYSGSEQLLHYQKNQLGIDFPVDDWLYSVARVREKMKALGKFSHAQRRIQRRS